MKLSAELEKAQNLGIVIHKLTSDNDVFVGKKEKIGLSILQQSLDIADGIVVLILADIKGAAFALARPLFETYVRGVWLLEHATDAELDKFLNGNCPGLSALVSKIGEKPENGGAWIKGTKELNLDSFHDLTHGGVTHVYRRVSNSSIEPNYSDEECINLLKLQADIQINIATFLLVLFNNQEGLNRLHEVSVLFRPQP